MRGGSIPADGRIVQRRLGDAYEAVVAGLIATAFPCLLGIFLFSRLSFNASPQPCPILPGMPIFWLSGESLMSRKIKRLGMLVVLGWLLQNSSLSAQAPGQTAVPAQPVPCAGAATVNAAVGGPVAGPAPVSNRPFQRCLNRHGLACASDFNQLGCGNLHSELAFIFGSCRTFFGQPCYPNPPHFGADGTRGVGPDGTRRAGRQNCCGN